MKFLRTVFTSILIASFTLFAIHFELRVAKGEDPNPVVSSDDTAKRLVQNALKAELNGRSVDRLDYLKAALNMDPQLDSARWHSGQILNAIGTNALPKWMPVAEAENAAAQNSVLAEYAKLRRTKLDDAAGNEALAKWCLRNGLNERARIHWARVLRYQPNHKTTLHRLHLKKFEGGWFTPEQINQIKKSQVKFAQLRRKWQPKLAAYRKVYLAKNLSAREEVRHAIKRDIDAELVGLFETQLSPVNQSLALAVVDSLRGVEEQVATESLVRHAILSKWSAVRSAAVDELKTRPLHGYVPILIDAMMSPYHFQSWSVRSPLDEDHVLALNYSVEQKGKHADRRLGGTVNFLGARDDDRADDIREEMQERIEKLNEATEEFNKPIWNLLKTTTGQDLENDPSQWNDWWNDYNEYHVPEFKPVFTSFRRPRSVVIAVQPFSCFPAGVLVSTQTGRKPIETIQVGDFVLSQDPISGELSYKAVLDTTVRESDAIMQVETNSESLLVTRGHPLWVNGRQWQMAKQLKSGDNLHGATGPVQVITTRPVKKKAKVYNLVVADFHTYFVGDSRLLVHDNSIYVPPGVDVPGLFSTHSEKSSDQ